MEKNIDAHRLDGVARFLGSQAVVICFASTTFLLGCALSIAKGDWVWLGRFGSLISIAGLIATSSPLFIKGIYKSQSGAGRLAWTDHNQNVITTTPEERSIGDTMIWGVGIAIAGGLISAFGEPLGNNLQSLIQKFLQCN